MKDWVKDHLPLVIWAGIVLFGLLLAIGVGNGVVHLPGQR